MKRYKVHFEGYALVEASSPENAKWMVEDGDEDYRSIIITEVEEDGNT